MPSTKVLAKVKESIQQGTPLVITTFKLPHDIEEQVVEIISYFLKELGQESLSDHITYCIRELATNAKKANTKRVYFEEKGLDINKKDDYAKGMETFKMETINNLEHYLQLQKDKGLYIKFVFHCVGTRMKITIRNNVEITKKEQMRVYDRIVRARAFDTLEQAFNEVIDDSEGAGLGLVIMVLMLKKLGLDEESFEIEGKDGETVTSLTIPVSSIRLEEMDALINEIVREIRGLPQFPENIMVIQKMISDPEVEMLDIARRISTDPSLTADLLKVVNSAQFMLTNKVDNIADAVKMIGLRGIRNLLFSYGTENILNMTEKKELWTHSHKVAFFAFNLARNVTKNKDVVDDAYVGGILHDIGKIVFSKVHPDLIEKIRTFTDQRELTSGLFESMSAGFNHSEIGAKIAEKWNFSDALIDSIRYHHEPSTCRTKNRLPVYCVYLANVLAHYSEGKVRFDQLDIQILKLFRITTEEEMASLSKRLENDYQRELLALSN